MAYFIGPQLNEEYKDYLRRVLTDGGFYSRPNPKDFQNDVDTILPLNPILYTPANAGKVSKMYSLIPDTGAGDFTVSRNGTARYSHKDGLLKTAAANVPRFEFDPVTGDFKGVLVEPVAVNSLLNTEDFNTTVWGAQNLNTTGWGGFTDPSGGSNAFKLIANTNTALHLLRQNRGISIPTQTVVNFSVFLKKSELERAGILFIGLDTTQVGAVNLNLSTRTIVSSNDIISGSERVDLFPDDWARYSFGFLSSANSTNFNFEIRLQNSSGVQNFAGNNVDGLIAFGPQLVVEQSFLTSYIKTEGSTVTRPADQITVTVPTGATQCVYVLDGVETTVSVTAGSTFTLPNGLITQLYMI
jgi:hypothetical protein